MKVVTRNGINDLTLDFKVWSAVDNDCLIEAIWKKTRNEKTITAIERVLSSPHDCNEKTLEYLSKIDQ